MRRNSDLKDYSEARQSDNLAGSKGSASSISAAERLKLRKGLRRSHLIVFRALEVANLRLSRVTTVSEVAECMLPDEAMWIGQNYAKELRTLITTILGLLIKRGLVFSPGRIGAKRYYGSTSILEPEKSPLPNALSRRQRVLGIVYRAVEHFGRAVRTGDVLDFCSSLGDEINIDPEFIARDILNLADNGELAVIGTVRGDENGTKLYLPSNMNPDSYMPREPLSWLEEVAKAFGQLWEEEVNRATNEGRRPRPIATGEVRARLTLSPNPNPKLDTLCYLPNALSQLADTKDALIRKVERPGKRSVMWAPVGMKNDALDLGDAYASDVERVAGALERACRRLGRPVTVSDVRDEVEMDPSLQPAGKLQLRNILSDISKEKIDAGDGVRRDRVTRRCFYVGKVKGASYYCHDAGTADEARSYIRFRQIELRWSESATMADPDAYMRCALPSVAIGRAMLVKTETEAITNDIDEFLREGVVDGATRHEAELLREQVSEVMGTASEWLTQNFMEGLSLPPEVSLDIPGWTASELLQSLKPVWPSAKEVKPHNRLLGTIWTNIRRFPNPEFESRFSKVSHKAFEYLYDRTDALLFAATRWGGRECCMQAMIVRSEVGTLRDPRFIYPALGSPIFEERLKAVASLAFLWSEEGNEILRRAAICDTESGIRVSALWAYGFAGGEQAKELLSQQAERDPDERACSLFRDISERLKANEGSWWKI